MLSDQLFGTVLRESLTLWFTQILEHGSEGRRARAFRPRARTIRTPAIKALQFFAEAQERAGSERLQVWLASF
jgi:hypothetical protein